MATSRRGSRPSERRPAPNSASASGTPGTAKSAESRRGPALSGSRRGPAGSRVSPSTSNRTPAAKESDSLPRAGQPVTSNRAPVPAPGNRSGGPVPKARTSTDAPAPSRPGAPADLRTPRAPATGTALPKAQSAPTGGSVARPANPPAGHAPRLSEQLRALPQNEAELPDIPILPPRDDSKIPRNWSGKPPDAGRGTTRHVKTGTAILTLESEDAVVIETDDENLVQASDNKIKALGSSTGIPVPTGKVSTQVPQAPNSVPARSTPPAAVAAQPARATTPPVAQVPVADNSAKGSKVARVSAVMKAIQTDPDQPSPARPESVPVAKKGKGSGASRVAKAVAEPPPAEATPETPAPVPVAEKKAKGSSISKVAKAVAEIAPTPVAEKTPAKTEPVPVTDKKKSKSSRISRVAKAVADEKMTDPHADQPHDDLKAPEPVEDGENASDADEESNEDRETGAGDKRRGSDRSSRASARGSSRPSGRSSSRSSDRATGSRRMSKQVDPVARRKQMTLVIVGGVVVLLLVVAFWYITGPMRTAGLIADIKGPDAGVAKAAVPALAEHLQGEAAQVYDRLAGEISDEARLEMLGEGLIKTAKMNSRSTSAVAQSWLASSHLGLRKAAAYALTKFAADNCTDGLVTILRRRDEDPDLRANAATALGFAKATGSAEALGVAALDPEENAKVQSAADNALNQVKENADSGVFLSLMRKYTDSKLRRKIMEAYIVDDTRRNDAGALDCYKIALADPDKDFRLLTIKKATARFETGQLSGLLLPMLKDPEVPIAVEVARFLGTVSGAGKQSALEAVLGGIQSTDLDPAVRKQLTVSLGHLSAYKDMTALKILMAALQAETDAEAQANLRGALTQVCMIKGGGNDRSGWSTEQWNQWWDKYSKFKDHYVKVKAEFDKLWKEFNQAGGMANETMSHAVDRLTQEINDMTENECDPEDRRQFEQVDTEMMMKNMGQMHKGGSVNFYPGNKK